MVETDEVLLIKAAYDHLTFSVAQAANTYPHLRDAARAIEQGEEYDYVVGNEERHNIQATENIVEPRLPCSICSDTIDERELFVFVSDEERQVNNNLCADCTEHLANELERYVEKNGDRLGEAL